MRRLPLVVGAAVAVVAVGAGTAAAVGFGGGPSEPAAGPRPPATVKVTKQTLVQTEDVDGTLGYGDAVPVNGRAPGTVTGLPAVGSTVDRGKPVYHVDNTPVVLLYGSLPPYRRLSSGASGPDVRQLEENLAALGYKGFTVDEEYTSSTASAVRSWQSSLGLAETGAVDIGRVVYVAGPVRVSEHKARVGDQATGALLTYTGTSRIVTVDLDVADRDLASAGAAATVTLPTGQRLPGTVASVGTVAVTSGGGQGSPAVTTIEVVVTVTDQSALGALDQAPVEVTLVASRRENVLTVPVGALLALAEGGYGLEVVEGGTTRTVAVQTGLFAGGRVEVSGAGIAEGTVVGVAS